MARIAFARRIRVSFATALLIALCALLPSSAQTPVPSNDSKPSDLPRVVSRTNLVLIPTVVADKNGEHITGLTKDDFYVRENGAAQKISAFEEITTHPGVIRRVDPNDNGFTNAVTDETRTQRLTMIVLDTLNTRFE